MKDVTPEAFMTFLWVAAAVIALTLAVWALVDKIKAAHKPSQNLAQWQHETDLKLDRDKKRIDSVEDGQRAICRGVLALLNHELHNGNTEEMEKAQAGINNYLIER